MIADLIREIQEFRAALASGKVGVCDGVELLNAISDVGLEYCQRPMAMNSSIEAQGQEVVCCSELTMLIEDLGGVIPVARRSETDIESCGISLSPAVLKVLWPIAVKYLIEYLERRRLPQPG